ARALLAGVRSPAGGRRRLRALPVAAQAGAGGLPGRRMTARAVAGALGRHDDAGASGLPRLEVRRLGTLAYADALRLQDELVRARRAGAIPDTLLLLQHPHVITLGSASDPSHVLAGEA